MHFDPVGFRIMVDPPYFSQQPLARKGLAGAFCQPPEQFELARVEPQPAAINTAIPVKQVEHHRASAKMAWQHFSPGEKRCATHMCQPDKSRRNAGIIQITAAGQTACCKYVL